MSVHIHYWFSVFVCVYKYFHRCVCSCTCVLYICILYNKLQVSSHVVLCCAYVKNPHFCTQFILNLMITLPQHNIYFSDEEKCDCKLKENKRKSKWNNQKDNALVLSL